MKEVTVRMEFPPEEIRWLKQVARENGWTLEKAIQEMCNDAYRREQSA